MTESKNVFVGIDLGTSRSSISTSDGEHHMVESFVGWPLDMVARKVLKQKVLVGRDALENRTMLDLHRPLERGLLKEGSDKDQQAVRELVSYLMEVSGVSQARKGGAKVRSVIGVPAEALRVNRQHLREAMRGFVDHLIIVSEPFAVAYGLDALLHALVVDIGAGTSDFCVMQGRYPTDEDQRTLPNAGDWIDDQILKILEETNPDLKASIHTARAWKEEFGFVGHSKKVVEVTTPISGKPTEIDITAALKQACEALVPPVAETMLDLITSIEPEFQERVRNNVILAGGIAPMSGLAQALEKAMAPYGGGNVQVAEDPIFQGADGGLALAMDAPRSDWEKLPA
ncbi:MAG: rod shape-determining protein [Thermoanaerobaculales bacterium]|nr:rod shape-determining protein [Thermoanaerobaculales bacterium]